MEEVQQGSNGTESQTAIIPTTITSSQFSQIAQQVTNRSLSKYHLKSISYIQIYYIAAVALLLIPLVHFVYECHALSTL